LSVQILVKKAKSPEGRRTYSTPQAPLTTQAFLKEQAAVPEIVAI
jgi:hypothetical protein